MALVAHFVAPYKESVPNLQWFQRLTSNLALDDGGYPTDDSQVLVVYDEGALKDSMMLEGFADHSVTNPDLGFRVQRLFSLGGDELILITQAGVNDGVYVLEPDWGLLTVEELDGTFELSANGQHKTPPLAHFVGMDASTYEALDPAERVEVFKEKFAIYRICATLEELEGKLRVMDSNDFEC